jgi:RNA polymerase sigma-70 factor (ECF subfamily)
VDAQSDEEVLVARMVAGDDSALGRVYDRYGGFVYALARRVTGDEGAAGDITQDVFTFLWEHPDRVDFSRGSLRSYLGVVTHRRAVNEVRSTVRRRSREERVVVRAEAPSGHEADAVEADAARWRAGRLHGFLLDLPAEQRQVLEMAYFDGCTLREVAARLCIPEGTAKSRLRLALSRLRAKMEAQPLEAWQ